MTSRCKIYGKQDKARLWKKQDKTIQDKTKQYGRSYTAHDIGCFNDPGLQDYGRRNWACHKSLFAQEFTSKMARNKTGTQTSCELAQSKCNRKCHKSQCVREFIYRMPQANSATQTLREPAQENALGDGTKATLREKKRVKRRGPRARHRLCASRCGRNALGNVTRAILCENLQVKCRGPRARHRLCASLRSQKHFDMAREPFDAET